MTLPAGPARSRTGRSITRCPPPPKLPRTPPPHKARPPLHEALPLRVAQDAALAAAALGDQAAGAIDAGGVELHKLEVLQGQSGARHHGVAVTLKGVGGRGGVGWGGVELHKLEVLQGQSGARHHGVAVTLKGVGGFGGTFVGAC